MVLYKELEVLKLLMHVKNMSRTVSLWFTYRRSSGNQCWKFTGKVCTAYRRTDLSEMWRRLCISIHHVT